MITQVLFASRHPINPEQVDHLISLFGEIVITQENITFRDVDHVAEICDDNAYDVVVAVVPTGMAIRLCNNLPLSVGQKLLVPESAPAPAKDGETRRFVHQGFLSLHGDFFSP